VAELGERIVGFAGVVPVPERRGWLLEDLVRDRHAPNGTSELLVDGVMSAAGREGCDWLTLGLSPLSGNVSLPLQVARRVLSFLYDFGGLRAYKAKLRPRQWSPIFLAHPHDQSALRAVLDALAAFAGGGFVHFGLRTLLRGPEVLLRALALLLVPWTALLALAPVEPWFGLAVIKWAWVGFDVALLLGFWLALRRPSAGLYTLLASAVTLDAVLTVVQAWVWNIPRVRGALEASVVVLACSAPVLVALMLWGARRRRWSELTG
jgi:phosphatidylglycerol lysyltransferase